MKRRPLAFFTSFTFLLLLSWPALARVQRIEVLSRQPMAFGYERIVAKVYFVLDQANAHNQAIADLDKADKPEMVSELLLLRPPGGGNHTLHLEIPNRGGVGMSADPSRDDFLFRRGYTLAWLGWQFDVRDDPERLHFEAPVARGVHGLVRADFIVDAKQAEHPLAHIIVGSIGGKGYSVAYQDAAANQLFERDDVEAPRRLVPREKWRFTSDRTITLEGGFLPGRIYEIVYSAKDPAIVGAGLAAVRDFVSYLKYEESAIAPVKTALGFGISQSGRFLRHFLYEGFNADEAGRQVFDGLLVHVAGAGRGNFNHRFAQPSRDSGQIVPALYPVDVFPFTDVPTNDPSSGKSAGLLDRAAAENVVPKIFYLNTGYEYWGRGASLIHTTPDGKKDVEIAPTSRIYVLNGHGHIGGPFPPERMPEAQELRGFLSYWPLTHALVEAMNAWVVEGKSPPPSRYPRLADGLLVPPESLPQVPPPGLSPKAYRPFRVDGAEPPNLLGSYPTLVAKVDADGNELGGVRMPFLSVPAGAYKPFNLRNPNVGFPQHRASFLAAFLPFDKAALAVRYGSREQYLGRFTGETLRLIDQRYLVREDFYPLVQRGLEIWDWIAARE